MLNFLKNIFEVKKGSPRASNGHYLRKVPVRENGRVTGFLYTQPRKNGVRFVGEVNHG